MCKKLICLISFVVLLSAAGSIQAETIIVGSHADTYMRAGAVRGAEVFMDIRGGAIDFAGYLRFDLSAFNILTVEDANLVLRSSGGASRNDVIVKINRQDVADVESYNRIMGELEPGDAVVIRARRGDRYITAQIERLSE